MIGFDLRGHGCSEGVSVHVRRFEDYHDDVARIVDHFGIDQRRMAVFAHSLGGLITVSACQTDVLNPAAVGLSAPLLRLRADVPLWKLAIGRLVKRAWPTTRFRSTVKPKHLLGDPELMVKRVADPLISRTLTAGWFFAVTRRANHVWNIPYDTPTRLVQGTSDRVVDPQGAVAWLRRGEVSATEGRFLTGQHELFHDAVGAELFSEMLDWYEARVPVRPVVLPFGKQATSSVAPRLASHFESVEVRRAA